MGFRVRFADQVSASTRLVLMTDGLLLAELGADPELRRYDTVIVDEAHERSLNVDLLLGVLKRLLPRRPELKLIVTSATLAVERVSRFFDDAPVLAVSGRSHPIEVRYAAAADQDERIRICRRPCSRPIRRSPPTPGRDRPGDVLVFLPGEREIRDVAELLERELEPSVEVLTLYSRLSWEQQSRIFNRGPRHRIVLATNVAETSITVPGHPRGHRFGARAHQPLQPTQPPAAPADRAGLARQRRPAQGPLRPDRSGACACACTRRRSSRRARSFTEPEVLRTNLAALLLRLAADGLGEAETFPVHRSARLARAQRRLSAAAGAAGVRRRAAHHRAAAGRWRACPWIRGSRGRCSRASASTRRVNCWRSPPGLSVPDARLATAESPTEEAAASRVRGSANRSSPRW